MRPRASETSSRTRGSTSKKSARSQIGPRSEYPVARACLDVGAEDFAWAAAVARGPRRRGPGVRAPIGPDACRRDVMRFTIAERRPDSRSAPR